MPPIVKTKRYLGPAATVRGHDRGDDAITVIVENNRQC